MKNTLLRQTEVHLKDFFFCNLNSTITYPSFELFECTDFIHVSRDDLTSR
jgi:hypothetical protein